MTLFVLVLVLIVAVALVAALAQRRVARYDVQDAWGLTDEEAARFQRELPEVERDIVERLPKGEFSKREIREMAEESTLKGILLKRMPKADDEE